MKIGTKSVLFGVHQFIWHPLTVLVAFTRFHKRWPDRAELVAIALHDLGYLGLPNMDGDEGQEHPFYSAQIFAKLYDRFISGRGNLAFVVKVTLLIMGHSKYYAQKKNLALSDLYAPDKLCVLVEPRWFYILRGWLSGEIDEFMENAPQDIFLLPPRWHRAGFFESYGSVRVTNKFRKYWIWLNWYRQHIRNRFNVKW